MAYPIHNASAAFFDTPVTKKWPTKYPWLTCPVGKSFAVSFDDGVKEQSLKNMAYRVGKKYNILFKVVRHDDTRVFEIGRLPDPIASPIASQSKSVTNEQPVVQQPMAGWQPLPGVTLPEDGPDILKWREDKKNGLI